MQRMNPCSTNSSFDYKSKLKEIKNDASYIELSLVSCKSKIKQFFEEQNRLKKLINQSDRFILMQTAYHQWRRSVLFKKIRRSQRKNC